MSNEVMDKVFQYVDALAAKLGVAAEYIIEVMVRMQITKGIVYSSFNIGTLILGTVFAIVCAKQGAKYDWKGEETARGWFIIVGSLITFIILFASILLNVRDTPDHIMRIFNPEYYAFKEILSLFGK